MFSVTKFTVSHAIVAQALKLREEPQKAFNVAEFDEQHGLDPVEDIITEKFNVAAFDEQHGLDAVEEITKMPTYTEELAKFEDVAKIANIDLDADNKYGSVDYPLNRRTWTFVYLLNDANEPVRPVYAADMAGNTMTAADMEQSLVEEKFTDADKLLFLKNLNKLPEAGELTMLEEPNGEFSQMLFDSCPLRQQLKAQGNNNPRDLVEFNEAQGHMDRPDNESSSDLAMTYWVVRLAFLLIVVLLACLIYSNSSREETSLDEKDVTEGN